MASSRTLAIGLLLLWGCGGGGDGGGDCDPIAATLVSRIEVDPPAAAVSDGESVQLTARAYSCNGSQLAAPTFTWLSADVTTVSVNSSGMAVGVKLGGPVAIKASAQGKEGAAQVSVVPRAVASVRVEPATANVAVGRTSTLLAKAFDADGNELPGRTASWSSGNDAIVTVAQNGAITGVVAGGPVTVTATIEGQSGSAQVTVVEAAVATVTVTPPSAEVAAGSTLQLTAVLKDDQGNILSGRAVLWTTTDATRAAVSSSGVVSGLLLGGPVTILATSEGRSGSSQITVVPGAAARLAFTVQPRNVVAGAIISPDVRVEVQDAGGNRIPTSTAPVTMSLGANPGSGVLSGTRTVNAVGGVATFTNLRISRTGTGYTLSAASPGLTDAVSSSFNVTPGPAASMRFSVQPSSTLAGTAIAPAVAVELLDAQGNVATGASSLVSLSIGNNPGGSTLSGTTSVAAVAGVATFSDISLNAVGAGYTLAAASQGLTGATSTPFTITPGAPATLSFVSQPTTTAAGAVISPAVQVEVRDAQGNLVTSPETAVTLTLGENSAGGTLGGTLSVNTVDGVAAFADLTVDVAASGYTLVASAEGLTVTSGAFEVTPGPAAVLLFLQEPTTTVIGQPITPPVRVEARDEFGNLAVGTMTIEKSAGPGTGVLSGTLAVEVSDGVATFSDLALNRTGTTYRLRASMGAASVQSVVFRIVLLF